MSGSVLPEVTSRTSTLQSKKSHTHTQHTHTHYITPHVQIESVETACPQPWTMLSQRQDSTEGLTGWLPANDVFV